MVKDACCYASESLSDGLERLIELSWGLMWFVEVFKDFDKVLLKGGLRGRMGVGWKRLGDTGYWSSMVVTDMSRFLIVFGSVSCEWDDWFGIICDLDAGFDGLGRGP